MFSWYVRLLSNRPLVVLATVAVVAATCAVLAAFLGDAPDFTDPAAGFVTRGTPLHGAQAAWTNLVENTAVGNEPHKLLSMYPLQQQQTTTTPLHLRTQSAGRRRSSRRRTSSSTSGYSGISSSDNETTTIRNSVQELQVDSNLYDRFQRCEVVPDARYARLIFESTSDAGGLGVFTVDAIHSMCAYETHARALSSYVALWTSASSGTDPGGECPFISLGTYVALLTNTSSCSAINSEHVDTFIALIDECAPSYRRHRRSTDCWIGTGESGASLASRPSACSADVPMLCRRPEIFDLFHYFIDRESYAVRTHDVGPRPRYVPMFLPVVVSERLARLYDDLQQLKPLPLPSAADYDGGSSGGSSSSTGHAASSGSYSVRVVAAEFGLKQITFQRVMRLDTVWIAVAAALVFVILFAFTGSLFVTCMSAVGMAVAVSVSYCLYRLAFGIEFFPFVNLLTVVVVVGVGADDLLVFAAAWRQVKASKDEHVLDMIVRSSLRSAGLSTLVTSLTTAGAFYAGAFTDVLAMRCFCLYAGTTVLTCYLVSVTWTPACFVALERWSLSSGSACRCRGGCAGSSADTPQPPLPPLQLRGVVARLAAFEGGGGSRRRWCDALCWLWLVLLTAVGVCALVCLLYWPRFRAQPSTDSLQLLPDEHPFEVYETRMRPRFDFESVDRSSVPLYFVWGVLPEFDGDFYDLRSDGRLRFDSRFDVASPDSQSWLMDAFCRGLRESRLVIDGSASHDWSPSMSCFVEDLVVYLEQQSCNSTYATPPCCAGGGSLCSTGLDGVGVESDSLSLDGGSTGLESGGNSSKDSMAVDVKSEQPSLQAGGSCGFPYERGYFERCLAVWASVANRYRLSKSYEPGVRFFTANGSVAAIVLRFWANISDATAADAAPAADDDATLAISGTEALAVDGRQQLEYYIRLREWFDQQLSAAPAAMRGGFVVAGDREASALLVDDVRRSVAQAVPRSLLITACVTAVLVFISTLNPVLLLYAALTVTCSASATLASLVLIGWELGILESVIISLAVGLSMDYTLHYIVAYRRDTGGSVVVGGSSSAARGSRRRRAAEAVVAVGDCICYAALTTFVAGACILPAGVLAYRRLGTFLTIMAAVSWLYSLLYLPPLLYLAGPSGDFLQLRLPLGSCWRCLRRVCTLCLGRGGRGGVGGKRLAAAETQHDRTSYVPSASTSSAPLVEAVTSVPASPATQHGCRMQLRTVSSGTRPTPGESNGSSTLLEVDEEELDEWHASELHGECLLLRAAGCDGNGGSTGGLMADGYLVADRESAI